MESHGQPLYPKATVAGTRTSVLVLTEEEIRQCVALDHRAIAVVEDAFARLAQGLATVPPVIGIEVSEHRGEVDVKTAYLQGLSSFAVKIASGFYSNAEKGLPNASGLMVVISSLTGFPEAVLIDNGYLTQLRTAAAGAIATKYLAREEIDTVGVIGAGLQGRYQVLALRLVRSFRRVLVSDGVAEAAVAYAAEMRALLGCMVVAESDASTVVRQSDILITSTPARAPHVRAEWLHPGLHITAMGSDAPEKQELFPEVLARADRLVCDLRSQCFVRGEIHHGLKAGLVTEEEVDELGEVASGRKPGRRDDAEITICDLTGVGVQDTAIALLAYGRAREQGIGTLFASHR